MSKKRPNSMGVVRTSDGKVSKMTFCVMDAQKNVIVTGRFQKLSVGAMDLLEEAVVLAKLYKAVLVDER